MRKHILTSRPRLRRIVLCVVAFAAVGFGDEGRRTWLQGAGLEGQTAWPDKHFTVDADGNISPSVGSVHSGQRAVWTFEPKPGQCARAADLD